VDSAGRALDELDKANKQVMENFGTLSKLLLELAGSYESKAQIEQAIAANKALIEQLKDMPGMEAAVIALENTNRQLGLLLDIMDSLNIEEINALYAYLEELSENIASTKDALNGTKEDIGELQKAFEELAEGIEQAANGADQLHNGTQELEKQVGGMHRGLDDMVKGAQPQMNNAAQLRQAGGTLLEGTSVLFDGLEEYISTIEELSSENAATIRDFTLRKEALEQYALEYNTFSGILEGMQGSVRILAKTPEILIEPLPVSGSNASANGPNFFKRIHEEVKALFD
ncbi:hypothetical protein LJB83_01340, partial [Clostridia bacterium OttesenSCG-928-F22]|nr:hypothetical protein [Clostridia bacterium OttesenSCG-928-F22]